MEEHFDKKSSWGKLNPGGAWLLWRATCLIVCEMSVVFLGSLVCVRCWIKDFGFPLVVVLSIKILDGVEEKLCMRAVEIKSTKL